MSVRVVGILLWTLLAFGWGGNALADDGTVQQRRFDWNAAPAQIPAAVVVESRPALAVPQLPSIRQNEGWAFLVELQKNMREKLATVVESMRSGEGRTFGWFLLICFAYGVVHALGPGHGKTVVVGYFMARRGRWMQGVALSSAITVVHVASAVVLLYALYGLARATVFPSFEAGRLGMEKASYLLLALTGVLLVGLAAYNALKAKKHAEAVGMATAREMLWVALVTGFVPCPAVALVVFFCLLNGLAWAGLAGAFAIGVGMALTNIAFGLAAIALRRGVSEGTHWFGRWAAPIQHGVSMAGGVMVAGLGILLFSATV